MSRLFNQFYFEQTDRYYQMLAERKAHEDALWQDFEERRMEEINQEIREEANALQVIVFEDGYRIHDHVKTKGRN